ncbi:MAG: DGQHR domain-containing protein [Flavipsychrobacter sp.]|nr:DGQHR domain-containing protein [Flavipsychrobacter sp.]
MKTQPNVLKAQRVIQKNQEFLISVITINELLRYTRYTERLIVGFDDNNVPIYNSEIQRKTDAYKVSLISDYLKNDPDAVFPTNIVLAIPSMIIDEFEEEGNFLTITFNSIVEEELNKPDGNVYISIIDGQHRLKGIEEAISSLRLEMLTIDKDKFPNKFDNRLKLLRNILEIQLPVTFFIDPVLEYQASIFSTINRTQTKVSESLVYSLFGLTDKTSPQKTSLEVTLALNGAKKSPFYNRIKLVGKKYARGESPALSQAAMVKSLIRCITPNLREAERERFKKREELRKGITPELCFRRYYAEDQDLKITKIMVAYYTAVKDSWKDSEDIPFWEIDAEENILQTTVGYEALLNLLKLILKDIQSQNSYKEGELFTDEGYSPYLNRIKIDFKDFERYPKTSVTKTALLQDMREQLGL